MTNTTQNTNQDGNAIFQLNLSTPGKYSVQSTFAGDSTYSSSASTIHNFKVPNTSSSKITPTLVMSCEETDNIIYCGVSATFTATVKNNNTGISGLTVYFVYINKNNVPVSMGNSTTNANGVASITFTSSDKTDSSTWDMYAYIESDSTYNAVRSSNITVTNKRVPTSLNLSASPSTLQSAGTTSLTARLVDTKTNTPITGKTIIFLCEGVSIGTATTDSTGYAEKTNVSVSTNTSFTAVYEEESSVCFAGANSNTATVTVGGGVQNTTLTVNSINNTSSLPLGSNLQVVGTLKTSGGTAISNATVRMNITSKTDSSVNINVTGSTNSSGQVTLTREVTGAGEWYVKLIYAGSQGVYNSSTSSTYTVTTYNQYSTSFGNVATSGSSLAYGDTIDPILKDYQGSALVSKSVSISLSWSSSFPSGSTATYTGTTIYNGKVYGNNGSDTGVKLQLAASGTLYVRISFAGDGTYDACTVTRNYAYTGGS